MTVKMGGSDGDAACGSDLSRGNEHTERGDQRDACAQSAHQRPAVAVDRGVEVWSGGRLQESVMNAEEQRARGCGDHEGQVSGLSCNGRRTSRSHGESRHVSSPSSHSEATTAIATCAQGLFGRRPCGVVDAKSLLALLRGYNALETSTVAL